MKLIIASTSGNRKELFARMGIKFEMVAPEFEEVIDDKAPTLKQIKEFALEKARSIFHKFSTEENVLIMGFDSMVDLDGKSIGKAKTKKEAFEMIQSFVGKKQKLSTGIAMVGNWQGSYFEKVESETTKIIFRSDTTNCQIRSYLEFNDWAGKCGAYSVLGPGIFFMKEIKGDFQNIIGVPVIKMGEMIREITGKAPWKVFKSL